MQRDGRAEIGEGTDKVAGGFSVLLLLDSDGGVAHGREVHGQPRGGHPPCASMVT